MIDVTKVIRQAEMADLADLAEEGITARRVYNDAIRTVIAEIRQRQSVLRELIALKKHHHTWVISDDEKRCYCDQCGADGDA